MQTTDTSPLLNEKGIKRIQGIVGALLYVGRSVNNKLIVALSVIGSQQAAATKDKVAAIEQLLDYVATYPNDGILFRKSDMILAAHADAGLDGIMKREHVRQLWMDISWTSETNFNTCNLKNPNIHHTNTAPLIM